MSNNLLIKSYMQQLGNIACGIEDGCSIEGHKGDEEIEEEAPNTARLAGLMERTFSARRKWIGKE